MTKQYSDRDTMALDQAGDYYLRHVQAMTREQLHTKSDIAAELGHRDLVIEQLTAERDALAATVEALKSELKQKDLIHIGFTNKSQIQYVTEDKDEGAFYPNSDHDCYIPIYMLNVHAHRVGSESKIYCTQLEQGKKIAEIRADAGRDGFVAGYFHYKNYGFQFEEELEAASNQHHASILAGKDGE